MRCATCNCENDPNDSFCGECGAPLIRYCGNCDAELKPGKNFCTKCGTAVAPTKSTDESQSFPARAVADYTPRHLVDRIRAEQQAMESRGATDGERKTITALFADLKGSTALIEGLDPEEEGRGACSRGRGARRRAERLGAGTAAVGSSPAQRAARSGAERVAARGGGRAPGRKAALCSPLPRATVEQRGDRHGTADLGEHGQGPPVSGAQAIATAARRAARFCFRGAEPVDRRTGWTRVRTDRRPRTPCHSPQRPAGPAGIRAWEA